MIPDDCLLDRRGLLDALGTLTEADELTIVRTAGKTRTILNFLDTVEGLITLTEVLETMEGLALNRSKDVIAGDIVMIFLMLVPTMGQVVAANAMLALIKNLMPQWELLAQF